MTPRWFSPGVGPVDSCRIDAEREQASAAAWAGSSQSPTTRQPPSWKREVAMLSGFVRLTTRAFGHRSRIAAAVARTPGVMRTAAARPAGPRVSSAGAPRASATLSSADRPARSP